VHRPGPGDRRRGRARVLRDEAEHKGDGEAVGLGATRCRDAARRHRWLLVRGRGERPLDRQVDAGAFAYHGSSKRPSLQPGELAILYASVWQAIFGVVEVAGEPEHDPRKERWAWRFPIRPLVLVDDLEQAPAVEEAGIFPQSLWRHSYIRLSGEQFESARALVERAGRRL
jgi:hypothetical protein